MINTIISVRGIQKISYTLYIRVCTFKNSLLPVTVQQVPDKQQVPAKKQVPDKWRNAFKLLKFD